MKSKMLLMIFLLNISLSLNALIPDKDNAVLLQENEIICKRGTTTYRINNFQNKKYFLLIKDYYIRDYALYEGDNKIEYETYSSNDYFFKLNGNNIIYLVAAPYIDYCLSFRLLDSNSIIMKENEEFLHPIVDYNTFIKTKINNVKKKHLIFYINNISSQYTIYVNNKSYSKHSSEVLSIIPEVDELEIEINIVSSRQVASLKYISIPYYNITSDYYKCVKDTEFFKRTYFIHLNETKKYLFISYNNNSFDYYKDDMMYSKLNEFNSKSYKSIFLLQKNKGCFQVFYLDSPWFEIKEGNSYTILNSERYNFMIHNKNDDISNIILSIYSEENNFLNELEIENHKIILQIEKENNLYLYKVNINLNWGSRYYISVKANFNLNSKDFINVNFKISEDINKEEKGNSSSSAKIGLIIMFSILGGILLIGIIARVVCIVLKKRKKIKLEEIKQMKLLQEEEFEEKARNIYQLIINDYTLIQKVCLICNEIDNTIITLDDNKEIDIIEDINNNRFSNILSYITPEKCCHLYHDKCCLKGNWDKKKLQNPKRCNFCVNFMTLNNMKKFGCFFSEKSFTKSLNLSGDDYKIKRENIKNIEDIFYSKLDTSYKINKSKRDNLLRLKKINSKFLKYQDLLHNDYFKYYSINYNSCDFDALEDDLNEEISRKKQERQRQQEKEREYEEQNRALPLLRCHDCYNTCLFCHGDMKSSFSGNHLRHYNTYKAHNRCINDKESCCICHYKKGTIVCENCCYYCYKSNPNRRYKCFYCKREFD